MMRGDLAVQGVVVALQGDAQGLRTHLGEELGRFLSVLRCDRDELLEELLPLDTIDNRQYCRRAMAGRQLPLCLSHHASGGVGLE